MTWEIKMIPPEMLTPEVLYDINRRHGLMHEDLSMAIPSLLQLAKDCEVYALYSRETHVATAIVSRVVPGHAAEFDLIPVGKFFRGSYQDNLRTALLPVVEGLLKKNELRRVSAFVPASRVRAVRALECLGFQEEGRMRKAVCLEGMKPEDLVVLGFVKEQ